MGYQLQYISCSNGGSFNTTLAALPTVDSVITIQFLKTNSSQDFDLKFGVDYADICLRRSYHDLYWYPKNGWNVQNYLTINEVHTASVSNTQYTFDENTFTPTGSTVAIPSTANFKLKYFYGNLYGFNSIANSTYDFNLVPWINDNDVVGLMDLVSNTFYTPAGGTWTAGPIAHVFEPSKPSLTFPASGGSITFDVEAETTWTASTPTFATLSPSTGGTGTTTVTATCPSYTGTTKREETITFTDNDSYTFDFKIRQRALTNGISNLYLGDNQIPTANAIYLGDAGVNTIYLGEEIIYSNGPFVGLKAAPQSLTLTNLANTANITIRSSEDWTITDDSGGWLSYSTTTGTTGKTVVTVTASTTQAERTATITVTSANYSATVGVTDKARLYLIPNDEIWYHQVGSNPIYPMRPYNQGDTWWVETDMTTPCWILSNTYDSNDGWWKIKWSGPLGRTTGTGFGQGFAAAMTEVMMPETMKREETHNWTYSTNLKKICYGASMESFAERVFNYMYLENIYIYAETCPTFTRPNTQWEYYGGTGVTLHYPAGSDYSSFPLPPNSTRIGDL